MLRLYASLCLIPDINFPKRPRRGFHKWLITYGVITPVIAIRRSSKRSGQNGVSDSATGAASIWNRCFGFVCGTEVAVINVKPVTAPKRNGCGSFAGLIFAFFPWFSHHGQRAGEQGAARYGLHCSALTLLGEPIRQSPKVVATISDSIPLARMLLQKLDLA
jgi:hypothetical protein